MNKLFKTAALLTVLAVMLGIFGVVAAFADEDETLTPGTMNAGQRGSGLWHEARQQAMAEALGVSVAELEAAHATGSTAMTLAAENGLDWQDARQAMAGARATAQTGGQGSLGLQAGPGPHGPGPGPLHEQFGLVDEATMHAALADALGLTVAEFDAARAAGTSLVVLAEQQGVALEDVRAAMAVVRDAAIEQALADGTLSAEDAALLQSRPGPGGMGAGMNAGMGGRGQQSGSGPGMGISRGQGGGQGRGQGTGSGN